ncbi:MAG: WD40 repeat domain-containing protein [Aureliella sp.]
MYIVSELLVDDGREPEANQGTKHRRAFKGLPVWSTLCMLLTMLWTLASSTEIALADPQESEGVPGTTRSAEETWISDVCWLDDQRVAGTQSQGLLLRPGAVVTAGVESLSELTRIGSANTSLWAITPGAGAGTPPVPGCYVSDYKGEIQFFPINANGAASSAKLESNLRWTRALAVGPAQKMLLAGSEDGKLVCFDLEDAKADDGKNVVQENKIVAAHSGAIFDIVFGPHGERVATCGADGKIAIFSWPDLESVGELRDGNETIWSIAFVGEDKMVSGGSGRRVRLWDLGEQELVCSIATAHDWVSSLSVLPDTQLVLATCVNGDLIVCDVNSKTPLERKRIAQSAIWSAALSPDVSKLLVGTRKHGFQIVELQDWSEALEIAADAVESRKPPKPLQSGTSGL